MKRSGFKSPGKPLERKKPMSRGTSTLTTKKPLQQGGQLATRKPMERAAKPMAAVGKRARRTGQGKVAPTAQEAAWMAWVQSFGCIVCWLQHQAKTPAAVHHLIAGGRRMGHLFTIGLCDPGHHQNSPNKQLKISRHPDKARFEAAYGTELELLATLQQIHAQELERAA